MMITIENRNGKNKFPEKIDKYGKGKLNTNGRCLLEYAKEHWNDTYQHNFQP